LVWKESMENFKQTIARLARILLYGAAVLPFIVWANFSFPYVTVRTSLFRIIVEIVLVLLIVMIIKSGARLGGLKRSYVFIAFGGLVAIELAAALFGGF